MNHKGLTLIELNIGFALVALALTSIGLLFGNFCNSSQFLESRINNEESISRAHKFIRRVGRVARSCKRVLSSELRCAVVFESPPSGVITGIRFFLNGSNLEYQSCSGTYNVTTHDCSAPAVWLTGLTFGDVLNFNICDTYMISNDTCLGFSNGINIIRSKKLSVRDDNRFFRYSLAGFVRDIKTSEIRHKITFAGAFFLRNLQSGGSDISSSLTYQWGG